MKNLIYLIVIFFAHPVLAQESATRFYFQFSTGDTAFVFGNKVNIRETPSKASSVIGQLTIGQAITVLHRTDSVSTFNKLKAVIVTGAVLPRTKMRF
mgnify:CR=1 FL=1